MTAFMVAAHRQLPRREQQPLPPREITMNAAHTAGVEPDHKTAATLAAHFSFGATAGLIYSGLAGLTRLPPVAEGALYGLGVWTSNYLGILPALGLVRPATRETAPRNGLMIAANVLWGAVAAGVYSRLRR